MDDSLGLSLNSNVHLPARCGNSSQILLKLAGLLCLQEDQHLSLLVFFRTVVDQHMSSASVQAPILWPRLSHSHNPKEYCCQVTSSSNMRSNSMIVILSPTTVSSSWGSKTKKYSHQIQVGPSLFSSVAFVKDDKLSQLELAIGCLFLPNRKSQASVPNLLCPSSSKSSKPKLQMTPNGRCEMHPNSRSDGQSSKRDQKGEIESKSRHPKALRSLRIVKALRNLQVQCYKIHRVTIWVKTRQLVQTFEEEAWQTWAQYIMPHVLDKTNNFIQFQLHPDRDDRAG